MDGHRTAQRVPGRPGFEQRFIGGLERLASLLTAGLPPLTGDPEVDTEIIRLYYRYAGDID